MQNRGKMKSRNCISKFMRELRSKIQGVRLNKTNITSLIHLKNDTWYAYIYERNDFLKKTNVKLSFRGQELRKRSMVVPRKQNYQVTIESLQSLVLLIFHSTLTIKTILTRRRVPSNLRRMMQNDIEVSRNEECYGNFKKHY